MESQSLLKIAETYLEKNVHPYAERIDDDVSLLHRSLIGLQEKGLLSLLIPQEYGGLEFPLTWFYDYQEMVAYYSGALSFLQTQHHSAIRMISQGKNEPLKAQKFSQILQGKLLLGIGFSHLRRMGEPLVTAIPVKDGLQKGYLLSGQVPWVTGWKFFQEFIIAATLPDQKILLGIIPFGDQEDYNRELVFSKPMPLVAMTSTNTVTARLQNWFLPQESVIFLETSDWIKKNDRRSILNPIPAMLGCAKAALNVIKKTMTTKNLPFIITAYHSLQEEWSQLKSQGEILRQGELEKQLDFRAKITQFMMRCSQIAVIVSGGTANHKLNPAGRIYREVIVYTVSGQSLSLMETMVNQLSE